MRGIQAFGTAFPLLIALVLTGCGKRPLQETELPPSQRNSTLADFKPPDLLSHIAEWYPGDWRVHLLQGLLDTALESRLSSLRKADSLNPDDVLPSYALAMACLSSGDPEVEKAARPYVDRALVLDPDNGVLKVMLAYVLLREDKVPQARALFLDPRRVPTGTFYHDRLEEVILGLVSHSRQWNPYTLTEAVAVYHGIPLPPFEKMIDILYSVFLSPLEEHPYDIRIRGRQAADAVFQLGRKLRVLSYAQHGVLNTGYEQRALGFMFQLRAAEFLTLFHRAFNDTAASRGAFNEVVEVQVEYEDFMAASADPESGVTAYMDSWSALIAQNPSLPLGQAVDLARAWPLWRRSLFFRYPVRDDRPSRP